MDFLTFLDRWHERRARRSRKPLDTKVLVGALFFAGYYALVWRLMGAAIAETNAPLVRDALLVLGPPVGAIVSALFRSDSRDDQLALNSGDAWRAVGAQAKATEAAAVAGTTVERNPNA